MSCIAEELTPYTLTVEYEDYTATAKVSWRKHFPTITMLQRNTKIEKSIYERFLLGRPRNSTTSSSSSSSLTTPQSSKHSPSDSVSSSNAVSHSMRDESFDSFRTIEQFDMKKSTQEKENEEANKLLIYEYVLNDDCNRSGIAKITMKDNTLMDLEFDIDATIEHPRVLKGNNGTHRWMAFKELVVPEKLSILVGDYVVVLGITNKRKSHIEDP